MRMNQSVKRRICHFLLVLKPWKLLTFHKFSLKVLYMQIYIHMSATVTNETYFGTSSHTKQNTAFLNVSNFSIYYSLAHIVILILNFKLESCT